MKRLWWWLVAGAVAVGCLMAGCSKNSGAGVDQSLNKVLDAQVLVLGLDDSFPPMGFRDEDHEIIGFDIDVARDVCKRLGVAFHPQPIDWNAKEEELESGRVDCIWNGLSITPAREQRMLFSEPYIRNAQVLVVRKDAPWQTPSELAGKTVGLQAGSTADDALASMTDFKASLKDLVEFKDNMTALEDLKSGGVDSVVMDLVLADDCILRLGEPLRVLEGELATENYGVGFRKRDVALRNAVQFALEEMAADGSLAAISKRWFGEDMTIVGK